MARPIKQCWWCGCSCVEGEESQWSGILVVPGIELAKAHMTGDQSSIKAILRESIWLCPVCRKNDAAKAAVLKLMD